MTATTSDEKVAAYLDNCGPSHRHEGYGFFWMLLEVVAAQLDGKGEKCSATYPLTTWSRLLYCHHHMVGKYLGKLGVTGMVTVTKHESSIEVKIPNLLKYRDEYARKSGHSPDSVRSKKQIQNTTDTDTPKPPAPTGAEKHSRKKSGKRTIAQIRESLGPERMVWWENFWRVYPIQEGTNPAMDAFERRVKDHDTAVLVWQGAKRYADKIAAERMSDPTVKVKWPQGWLNEERWLDSGQVNGSRPPLFDGPEGTDGYEVFK